ncbi:hypothetical protein EP51_40500 (plasmid) [Rhodococcus opacus]|uniref:ABC transmembrane type-1 domain-containing protein n=1 Tax=Rhodococcus opacus TaxID=37919 RepID=A0A076F420_RHOOP|nr:hypothetical protein EP51_40500 [Rhodococcus opacus]
MRELLVTPGAADRDPIRHARHRRRQHLLLGWLTPVVFLALWQLAASTGWIDTRFFPSPVSIGATAVELLGAGTLEHNVWVSTQRIILGFLLGVLVGVATGMLLGLSRIARSALEPFLSALYTIPKLALLPLLLLIFGLGELPKILLVALGVFFLMWITVVEAILDIPEVYEEAARSFGASPWMTFRHVTFPAALPQIFVGMRLAIGNAVLVLIGIEFVQSDDGIGYQIWHSWSLFAAKPMYVGIVTVALMGLILTLTIKLAGRVAVPWKGRGRTARS